MYLKMTIKDKQKRKGQEPLLSEDKYESTNLWLLKLKSIFDNEESIFIREERSVHQSTHSLRRPS